MATRATHSASCKARVTEAVATGPLGALSHDELGVIFDGLADPLQPVVAVALSSTCLGLRTPLLAALKVLQERHARATALCRKMGIGVVLLRDANDLYWNNKGFTTDDMATLGMILRTNGLPRLQRVYLSRSSLSDADMQALCEGLGPGAAPSLFQLNLNGNKIGPAGAEAFAAALGRGAMPKLEELHLTGNPIRDQGTAALAAPLRMMPALRILDLSLCDIGDEGVASLVANLGKDDFKVLDRLDLDRNEITDAGCATLARVRDAPDTNALPGLFTLYLFGNPASMAAQQATNDALGCWRDM